MKQTPKSIEQPRYRTPNHSVEPGSHDKKCVRFRFDLLDFEHAFWGWSNLNENEYLDVVKFWHSIEKQTWAELKLAAGGKRRGTNHHSLEIANFSKIAQKRVRELNLEGIVGDELFSFRMSNGTRLYGLRTEEWFRTIWHDPHHTNPHKAAYPIGER